MTNSTSQAAGAIHLSTADFAATLEKSNQPILVDFFANWCGPCQMAAPIIDKLAKEYDGKAIIAKVDVDDNSDIAQQYEVMSIPTVIVLTKNDKGEYKVTDRQVGFAGEGGYRQMLDKALKA